MVKKVLVACCDDYVKEIIRKNLDDNFKGVEFVDINGMQSLLIEMSINEEPVIVMDKYFMGYAIGFKLLRFKLMNSKAHLYVCERGSCSMFYGARLYILKFDGFITNIENNEHLKTELRKVTDKRNTYPKEVREFIEENNLLLNKRFCSEITEKEMQVGLYLGSGKSNKEISYLMGVTVSAVNQYVHRLKKKIGYKTHNDYILLNKQDLYGVSGGNI